MGEHRFNKIKRKKNPRESQRTKSYQLEGNK
jgi:hypothetical protein